MLRHVAGLGATVALLSGCTVPVVGMAGVGLDANGELVGYLSVCEDHIDGATLYLDSSNPERSVDAGIWEALAPVTRSARWSMTDPSDGWTALTRLTVLQPGREYTLYGWTNDNSAATTSVTFTLEEVQDLARAASSTSPGIVTRRPDGGTTPPLPKAILWTLHVGPDFFAGAAVACAPRSLRQMRTLAPQAQRHS